MIVAAKLFCRNHGPEQVKPCWGSWQVLLKRLKRRNSFRPVRAPSRVWQRGALGVAFALPVPPKHSRCRAHRTRFTSPSAGKASSDTPAFKPYRGKPAVRNFRGGDGNVGIIRSPVRAIALPDRAPAGGRANERRGLGNTCGRMSSALDETTKPLLVSVVNGGFSVKLGRFQGSLRKSNDIIAEPSCATARCR